MTHEDKLMEWFKEHNVENLNKALTKQNEPIVIYNLEEFMDGQKLEDDVNVILPYGVLRKLYNEKCTFEMTHGFMNCNTVIMDNNRKGVE